MKYYFELKLNTGKVEETKFILFDSFEEYAKFLKDFNLSSYVNPNTDFTISFYSSEIDLRSR